MVNKCCASTFDGWRSHQCNKPSKFEFDGKHYCGIHNPNKVKTKAQIRAEEKWDDTQKKNKLHGAAHDLLEFAKLIVSGEGKSISEIMQQGKAVIAKATGETQ